MAEERDPELSQRYRELAGEEPSRELDQAILAAARRSVRAGRHRWYYSLAAAAVLVLAIAVTVHVERQQPDAERAVPPPSPPGAALRQNKVEPSPQTAPPAAPPQSRPDVPAREERRQAYTPDPTPMKQQSADTATEAEPKPQAESRAAASRAATSPEIELERIAELRRQGRDEEADKALAEFRKRYPGHVISEAMKAKVERR
jgi:hypothetical protein